MPALIALLVLYLVVVLLVLPIWAWIKLSRHDDQVESLQRQLSLLGIEFNNLRAELKPRPAAPSSQPAASAAPVAPPAASPVRADPLPPIPVVTAPAPPPEPTAVASTPIARPAEPVLAPAGLVSSSAPPPVAADAAAEPPPLLPEPVRAAPAPVAYTPPPPTPSWMDNIDWEQFMGAKLFAWLGGFALFLGVAFFVKYSLDHGWIPPEVRVAIGFVLGAGLVVGGMNIPRKNYAVLAQALIATGVVSLYAVTFACGKDHYNFLGPVAMFLVMSLITTTAFLLAVRLEAQVVAILGLLGGFLTPPLLSTGHDNPPGLFGYLALLNIGLVAVALHRRWFHLVPLGAAGTVLMMIGWANKFYEPEKTTIAMTVCLGFSALFLAATEVARRLGRESRLLDQTALVLPLVAFGFAWFFLDYPEVADRTVLLFGFVFLVGAGLMFHAWRSGWGWLVTSAAGATAVLMIRWTVETFQAEQAPVVVTVCLVFSAIYFAVYLLARRFERATPPVLWAAAGLPAVALTFALFLMVHAAVGARPGLLFGFILASDGLLLALAWLDERVPRLHLAAGLAVFGLLSVWTAWHLTDALLPWALAMFLVFAALHTVFPLVLERKRPAAAPTWWSQLFPPLALLLMLLPLFKLETVSLLLWPAILLVDLIAIGLAVLSASLAAVAAVLILTLVATGVCIFRVPVNVMFGPSLLLVIGGFAVFFFAASLWLVRKLGDRLPAAAGQWTAIVGDPRAQLPAFASLLPFLLLIMASARLNVPDPSAIFGLGLLLVVLTLGLARQLVIEWLPACALAGIAALEFVWHSGHFNPANATVPLVWSVGFYLIFAVYPFVFRRDFAALTGPWTVAAVSGLAHFWVVYHTIKLAWPNDVLGLVPAVFAVAPLGGLAFILRTVPVTQPARLSQLAWFGGVALFFITLIFPIQFERQWLTVAWALEGAALLWLFLRVPHPGLRATGAALLVTAFARLALNPAVLDYHVRGDTGIWNWYLYAYGLAAGALFVGARLLSGPEADEGTPPRALVFGINAVPLLNTLGVILAFLLLNIEIADYFTAPGADSLAFQFSGNHARDMSYTIGWALFAFGLLAAGIRQHTRAARYAAIALLSVALLKLFLHDLAHLEALYRVGALFGVAVIAILASFAYQRFLPSHDKTPPPKS